MDSKELEEFLDQQRWLLNNGLVTDSVKNQLFFCGSIVHSEVQAVELSIAPDEKRVDYTIYVSKNVIDKIALYKKLSTSTSLYGMWRFKRFLKKEGALDFPGMLTKFVTDFCGPKWSATATIVNFDEYVEATGEQGETDKSSQQLNKLPD